MSVLVIWILIYVQPRTTIRHLGIVCVHILVYALLGILAHLARELSISPHFRLIGVSHGKSTLLGRVKPSHEGDVTNILRTPKSISALGLNPTRLVVTAPLGGSI